MLQSILERAWVEPFGRTVEILKNISSKFHKIPFSFLQQFFDDSKSKKCVTLSVSVSVTEIVFSKSKF